MFRFLPALIVILAGLFLLPDLAHARTRQTSAEAALAAEESRRETGELLVLILLALGIGTAVVIQGVREFVTCLPRSRPIYLDDEDDYDD